MKATIGTILLLAAIAHAAPPKYKVTLCQSWNEKSQPEGITNEFFTDNASVRVILTSEKPAEAGHTLTPRIVRITDAGAEVVAGGEPLKLDGTSNLHGFGQGLAGAAWARQGGKFAYRVYWDDEKEPIVDAAFSIKVGQRFALLVGISDYPPLGEGGPDLPASADDAARMRDLLVEALGFQSQNITLVQDLDATAARLRKELAALAQKAGPNDAVLFYYCGHGTQIPDLNGDEADGWDEALATADQKPDLLTTADHLKLVLSDDEISDLLANFRTKNVTVIFDSCHSGTAVRAGEGLSFVDAEGVHIPMSDEQNVARKLVEAAQDAKRKQPKGVATGLDMDQGYVFLSAARSWETGMTNKEGCFFSKELRRAMRNADGQSWDDIIRVVRPRVHRWNIGQSPQAAGAVRRYPFSLTEAPKDAPYERPALAAIGGMEPGKPKTLLVRVGPGKIALVSGLQTLAVESKDVLCDVYMGGALGRMLAPHGRVRLTGKTADWKPVPDKVHTFAAADVLSGYMRRGDRLVPLTVRVPDAVPTVGFTFYNRTTPQQRKAMQSALQSLVRLMKSDIALKIRLRAPLSSVDYIVVPEMKDSKMVAAVITPGSNLIGHSSGNPTTLAKGVSALVTARHQQFARFSRISNPSPDMRLRMVVKGGESRRKAGTKIQCRAYVDRPAYIYVFAAMQGQAPTFLTQSNSPLKANEDTAGTKGKLALKVIASRKPLDVRSVRNAETLLQQLRKAYPAAEGGTEFLATAGWADEVVWIDYR